MTVAQALRYEEALALVLRATPLPTERVAIEASVGHALAGAVTSTVTLPPWDNAGMDGYAVRRADVAGASRTAPVRLRVTGTISAGADPARLAPVDDGCAVRIMTGAPVPPGAQAVVRVEDTAMEGDEVVVMHDRDLAGRANVRPRGEDITPGVALFGAGSSITPAHVGVFASIGVREVLVHRAPRVALVSGGDELVLLDAFDAVQAGQRIVSSSSYALPALLRASGATVDVRPLMADTLAATIDGIAAAVASGCDLLLTTGGVSVGAHDHVRAAVMALGGEIALWRARIRPGGPIGIGRVGSVPWLGLPGNPVSTMVTGMLFALPLLRQLGGHGATQHRWVRVRLRSAADTPAPLTHFLRAHVVTTSDGSLEASLMPAQGSNLLLPLAQANALVRVPEAVDRVAPGDALDALLLPQAAWHDAAWQDAAPDTLVGTPT